MKTWIVIEQETHPMHLAWVDWKPSLLRGRKAKHAADEKSLEGMPTLHPRHLELVLAQVEDAENQIKPFEGRHVKDHEGIKVCKTCSELRAKRKQTW